MKWKHPEGVFCCWGPLRASITSTVASGEGGPNFSKFVQKFTFWATVGVMLAQSFGENWSKPKLFHFLGSCWRPCVARIPSHWPLVVFFGYYFIFCQKFKFLSNSRCYAGPDFWSTLRKNEAFSLLEVLLVALCECMTPSHATDISRSLSLCVSPWLMGIGASVGIRRFETWSLDVWHVRCWNTGL